MASHLKICQWIRHPHPWLHETHTQVGKWRGWGNEKVSEYRAQSVKSANEKKNLGEGNGDGNIYHSKARMLVLMLHLFFFFFLGSLLPRAMWLGGDGTFIWIQSKMLNYSALMSVILALSLVLYCLKAWKGRCTGMMGRGCAVLFRPLQAHPPSSARCSLPWRMSWRHCKVTSSFLPVDLDQWGVQGSEERGRGGQGIYSEAHFRSEILGCLFMISGNHSLSSSPRLKDDSIFYLNSSGYSLFLVSLYP